MQAKVLVHFPWLAVFIDVPFVLSFGTQLPLPASHSQSPELQAVLPLAASRSRSPELRGELPLPI